MLKIQCIDVEAEQNKKYFSFSINLNDNFILDDHFQNNFKKSILFKDTNINILFKNTILIEKNI